MACKGLTLLHIFWVFSALHCVHKRRNLDFAATAVSVCQCVSGRCFKMQTSVVDLKTWWVNFSGSMFMSSSLMVSVDRSSVILTSFLLYL